jgi:hypothetical protein
MKRILVSNTVKTATPAKPAWPLIGVASERLRAFLQLAS